MPCKEPRHSTPGINDPIGKKERKRCKRDPNEPSGNEWQLLTDMKGAIEQQGIEITTCQAQTNDGQPYQTIHTEMSYCDAHHPKVEKN